MLVRRNGFILLEAVIALALISCAIIPITSYPYKVFAAERKKLQEIEAQRISDLAFSTLVKEVSNSITIEELNHGPISLKLGEYLIDLGSLGKFTYTTNAEITIKSSDESYYLLKCSLITKTENKKAFGPLKSEYFLLANNN